MHISNNRGKQDIYVLREVKTEKYDFRQNIQALGQPEKPRKHLEVPR